MLFSASALGGSKSPQLSKDEMESLVQDAVVWANQHGLVRNTPLHGPCGLPCMTTPTLPQVVALKDKAFTNPDLAVIHAPLAALPVAFPRERFLQVSWWRHQKGGVRAGPREGRS